MGDGYSVETDELYFHANSLEGIQSRFEAVQSASSHIVQDDQAYGLLCGWIAGVLEEKHQRQDELTDYVAENLGLSATTMRDCVQNYDESDEEFSEVFADLDSQLD